MKLNSNQKKILEKLIQKYEGSKTYAELNRVSQNFYVKPSEFFKNYYSDFADVDEVGDFENELKELQTENVVDIKLKKNSDVIDKIYLNISKVDLIRKMIGVKEKKEIQSEEISFFKRHLGQKDFSEWYSKQEIEKLRCGKKSRYSLEETKIIFDIVDKIMNNKDELLERELSILLFKNSKTFENKYRSKVCRLLYEYLKVTDKVDDFDNGIHSDTEKEHLLLERYGIYQNPAYVYIKGDFSIKYSDDKVIEAKSGFPIALSMSLIKEVKKISVNAKNIITVENLTTFHRIERENTVFIYTGGYSGRGVRDILKNINSENLNLQFYHFGDLDPDGFCILQNLIDSTGISINSLYMDIKTMIRYGTYKKTLTERDKSLAENLIERGCFVDILNYMIKENIKIEQEIITME